MKHTLILFGAIFAISSCASVAQLPQVPERATISTEFETGNVANIEKTATGFTLTITPEDTPINDSPWYAFDIKDAKNQPVSITLSYIDGTHRYAPKMQLANGNWVEATNNIVVSEDEKTAEFIITPKSDSLRIAAQPIIDTDDHLAWSQDMAALSYVAFDVIGSSVEGRDIYKLEEVDAPEDDKPYVVLVGRQHPPELTGAQALMPFVETVWGPSDLAQQFRDHFNVIVIPMINPDGVALGHWRHNVGGLDLNRDWGPFTQPETQAVAKELERFRSGQDDMVLFLDFHSTWRNLIYTQLDSEASKPAFFTRDWIANVKAALPDDVYSFTREARKTSDRPIAKNYIYHTYGIPAMTFEVGDDTPSSSTQKASEIFAQEMMKLLLETAS